LPASFQTKRFSPGGLILNLSAPTYPLFLVSVVLAIIGIFARYGNFSAGLEPFHWALLAFIVLAAGNVLRKL
jgi:hypothetical protein